MNPKEFNERLFRLRKGEKVPCRHCEKGIMIPVGDYKTTKCFLIFKNGYKNTTGISTGGINQYSILLHTYHK